jgi:hypothetical protein
MSVAWAGLGADRLKNATAPTAAVIAIFLATDNAKKM